MKKSIITSLYLFFTFSLLFLLSGCSFSIRTVDLDSPYLKDLKYSMDDKSFLVIGYIDMEESPAKLQRIRIKQIKPEPDNQIGFGFLIADDMFYNVYLKPGIYKFADFGGLSKTNFIDNKRYTFSFPAQGKGEWDPVLEKPGIYFVGSYKYKKVKTGLLEEGKFDLEKINNPTEKEVLQKLLKYSEKTKWEAIILNRIKELEK